MAFTFAVVAGLASVLTELVARFRGLRAQYLLQGLHELLDATPGEVNLKEVTALYRRWALTSWIEVNPPLWADPASPQSLGSVDSTAAKEWCSRLEEKAQSLQFADDEFSCEEWANSAEQFAADRASRGEQIDWAAWEFAQWGNAGHATEVLLGTPIVRNIGMKGQITSHAIVGKPKKAQAGEGTQGRSWHPWRDLKRRVNNYRQLRAIPQYLSGRMFANGVFAVLGLSSESEPTLEEVRKSVARLGAFPTLKSQLDNLLTTSGTSLEAFQNSVEHWYDDHMDRVSGWYKRHIAFWTFAIGALLVILLNINSIAIATTLFADKDVRDAVTALATQSAQCTQPSDTSTAAATSNADGVTNRDITACLTNLESQLTSARTAGLPIGWPIVAACQAHEECAVFQRYGLLPRGSNFPDWQPVLITIGWLLTIIALVPGARFWFDVVGKLGSLRSTGPKPSSSS